MRILGIIPSRYASTRFPGKPLIDIRGKSMIQRVIEQVSKSKSITDVIVATDDQRIYDHVTELGYNACMTSISHESGTDRCYEALQTQKKSYDYVINIQGDEPFIQPDQIDLLVSVLDNKTQLATLIKPIDKSEQLFDPNVVKAIKTSNGHAINFSRSAIPFCRGIEQSDWIKLHEYYKHIGIYAYRTDILKQITQLPISSLEKVESLEQLRWIENEYTVKTAVTNHESIGIDTPEDLRKVIEALT